MPRQGSLHEDPNPSGRGAYRPISGVEEISLQWRHFNIILRDPFAILDVPHLRGLREKSNGALVS